MPEPRAIQDQGPPLPSTVPVGETIKDIVLSYDGATMCMETEEGVFIFDVPTRFR
jgi:hypothetical protein